MGHSLIRLLVRLHRSLVRLLHTARFGHPLRSFAPERARSPVSKLVRQLNIFVRFSKYPESMCRGRYNFNPQCTVLWSIQFQPTVHCAAVDTTSTYSALCRGRYNFNLQCTVQWSIQFQPTVHCAAVDTTSTYSALCNG